MKSKTISFLVYFVIAFGAICLVPWTHDKTGQFTINIVSVYNNQFAGWQGLLTCHLIVSMALAVGALLLETMLHLLFNRSRP